MAMHFCIEKFAYMYLGAWVILNLAWTCGIVNYKGIAFIGKEHDGFKRFYFLGSGCAAGFPAAGREPLCAGSRKAAADHPAAYRRGTTRKSVSRVAWMFSYAERSRIQDVSAALREGNGGSGAGSRSVD